MVAGFVIWSVVSVIFICIGISCVKSTDVVGFFTFGEPPVVEDVKAYNKAVGILWFVYAVVFEIIGIPILFLEQNSPFFIFIIFPVVIWVISLIVIYLRIENKYTRKK